MPIGEVKMLYGSNHRIFDNIGDKIKVTTKMGYNQATSHCVCKQYKYIWWYYERVYERVYFKL